MLSLVIYVNLGEFREDHIKLWKNSGSDVLMFTHFDIYSSNNYNFLISK